MPRISLAPFVLAACVLVAQPISASHYFLEDAQYFSADEVEAFQRIDMRDTETVLRALITPEQRGAAVFVTGIDGQRIYEIAQICELLQVTGVGPRVAELLLLSGVRGVADLAARDAAALLAEVENVNSVHSIVATYPGLEHVEEWIAGARAARYHLRF